MDPTTILVAEDDHIMRMLLQHHLQRAGYTVLSALNGAEAIERTETQSVDLVITDLYMPFLNGVEVCQRLRDNVQTRAIPVIMISAPPERLSKHEVASAGIFAWITKPFNPAELVATIQKALHI